MPGVGKAVSEVRGEVSRMLNQNVIHTQIKWKPRMPSGTHDIPLVK